MHFRPCIDLHNGKVKQIVGSSLGADGSAVENFVSQESPAYYAELYWKDGLTGGHLILLGPGNENAAREALSVHPGHLQVGGGVTPDNAQQWLDAGAGKLIVTSWLFPNGELDFERLARFTREFSRERLVLDLSCRPVDGEYHVTCNRWQTTCAFTITPQTLRQLADSCSEFLIHAVQVEGKKSGIDRRLVELLAEGCGGKIPVTYAGGIRSFEDIQELENVGGGHVDFTVGSALDIFGGTLPYAELAAKYR